MLKTDEHSHVSTHICRHIHTTIHILKDLKGWILQLPEAHTCPTPHWHHEGNLGPFQWAIKTCGCRPRSTGRFPQGCPKEIWWWTRAAACRWNNLHSRLNQRTLHWATWARFIPTALTSELPQQQLSCHPANSSLSQPYSSVSVTKKRGKKGWIVL